MSTDTGERVIAAYEFPTHRDGTHQPNGELPEFDSNFLENEPNSAIRDPVHFFGQARIESDLRLASALDAMECEIGEWLQLLGPGIKIWDLSRARETLAVFGLDTANVSLIREVEEAVGSCAVKPFTERLRNKAKYLWEMQFGNNTDHKRPWIPSSLETEEDEAHPSAKQTMSGGVLCDSLCRLHNYAVIHNMKVSVLAMMEGSDESPGVRWYVLHVGIRTCDCRIFAGLTKEGKNSSPVLSVFKAVELGKVKAPDETARPRQYQGEGRLCLSGAMNIQTRESVMECKTENRLQQKFDGIFVDRLEDIAQIRAALLETGKNIRFPKASADSFSTAFLESFFGRGVTSHGNSDKTQSKKLRMLTRTKRGEGIFRFEIMEANMLPDNKHEFCVTDVYGVSLTEGNKRVDPFAPVGEKLFSIRHCRNFVIRSVYIEDMTSLIVVGTEKVSTKCSDILVLQGECGNQHICNMYEAYRIEGAEWVNSSVGWVEGDSDTYRGLCIAILCNKDEARRLYELKRPVNRYKGYCRLTAVETDAAKVPRDCKFVAVETSGIYCLPTVRQGDGSGDAITIKGLQYVVKDTMIHNGKLCVYAKSHENVYIWRRLSSKEGGILKWDECRWEHSIEVAVNKANGVVPLAVEYERRLFLMENKGWYHPACRNVALSANIKSKLHRFLKRARASIEARVKDFGVNCLLLACIDVGLQDSGPRTMRSGNQLGIFMTGHDDHPVMYDTLDDEGGACKRRAIRLYFGNGTSAAGLSEYRTICQLRAAFCYSLVIRILGPGLLVKDWLMDGKQRSSLCMTDRATTVNLIAHMVALYGVLLSFGEEDAELVMEAVGLRTQNVHFDAFIERLRTIQRPE